MREFIFLLAGGLALAFAPGAGARAQQQRRADAGRVVYADRFPGADLGARINAADASLGTAPGEIVVRDGGRIATQIVVSPGHTLRLSAGVYTPVTRGAPILLKPGSSLVGAGRDRTVVLETPAPGQFTVISAYNHAQRNGSADSDLSVRDLQVKGANPGFDSVQQAVSLGNCSRCAVENVWVNGTRSIGIQLGGSGREGHFAANSKVVNCLFTRVASQNLALVNGRDILFENNRFLAPGQAGGPGSTAIDLEVNEASDRLERVTISGNQIDARETALDTAGNGIVVQATSGTTQVGPVVVENNTIIGGSTEGTITNKLSNGIYAYGPTMREVTIRNNRVTRTGQSGIRIEGARYTVVNNEFRDIGGGGIPGFVLVDVSDSLIANNRLSYSGAGPMDGRIIIQGFDRNNRFRDNTGFAAPQRAQ